ncbi:MAG: DUF6179 domain-containing protein [Oscillospiraceae bacterium]|jgi:hypothetical protein|nr:DUF6179 domain-containing protein [Oscillospiraceae bacterium]
MDNIEKIRLIDESRLNSELYFQSLIEEACRLGMITDAELEKIRLGCLELLARKIEFYTKGESSSVRVEIAEMIMASNLFTIGLRLKAYPDADSAAEALTKTKIAELYDSGRQLIDKKLKSAKLTYVRLRRNKLQTQNLAYNKTVDADVKTFFKKYHPDFNAHEIPVTPDYPLCKPIDGLVGIEFLEEYLKSLYSENAFCARFDPNNLHRMLLDCDPRYPDLLINIYECVRAADSHIEV